MYRLLSDLRVLEMAMHLEKTLELYEAALRDLVPESTIRATLAPLLEGGPSHDMLVKIHAELSQRAKDLKEPLDTTELLQLMIECERIAHDFYVSHLDRLSDPRLVGLFTRLAQEERLHMATAQIALDKVRELRRVWPRPTTKAQPSVPSQ